jgi:prepilin-type N-terminal cleavage/methylation domain-containing protein
MRVSRAGFTLVELLVVISIIGVLMSLLLPAVNASREAANRAVCTNNMAEIGKAMQNFVTTKQYFPGYRNPKLHANANVPSVSWQIALLPYLSQESLYNTWIDNPQGQVSKLELLTCPSDANARATLTGATSYVVNAGKVDPAPGPNADYSRHRFEGVCNDLTVSGNLAKLKLPLDKIPDGQQSTIFATENLDANEWFEPGRNNPEDLMGCLWGSGQLRINQNRGKRPAPGTLENTFARPASNHAGVVVALFTGGNVKTVEENVALDIWERLMTPNGKECQPSQNPAIPADGTY